MATKKVGGSSSSTTVTVPVHVNVVPGDQAAGRVPDPVLRSELVYLRALRMPTNIVWGATSG
jgi:hypothetical protein